MFLSSLYQQKIIKNYQNSLGKNLKDQFLGLNKRQKVRLKYDKMSIEIFSNQVLLVLMC